jgi:hypothetical protein
MLGGTGREVILCAREKKLDENVKLTFFLSILIRYFLFV